MTQIEQILKMPDSDIKGSGVFVKQIFEDYKRVSEHKFFKTTLWQLK